MPLTPHDADLEHLDYLAEERSARELEELGPQCAGCGEFCGSEHFDVADEESYCVGCSLQLSVHIANGAIPHGGTENDPDSLTILGVRS